MHVQKNIITAFATGALLLNALTPLALADTSLDITGNGSSSQNTVSTSTNQSSTVVQNNTATVNNSVTSNSSTGGNRANDNTGGDVTIDTGNATSNVDVSTEVNKNIADLSGCTTCGGNSSVTISGNGSQSRNSVDLSSSTDNASQVFQTNKADITNDITANSQTGHNDANRNTGGDVLVLTGHAQSNVDVRNAANANIATTGGNGGNGGGSLDAKITGNGSYSNNDIQLENNRSTTVVQDNYADIYNNVTANAKTGHNRANDNTGGDVTIDTGNALADTRIANLANFNAADLGCGCDMTINAKISGNGSRSRNDIEADLSNPSSAFQTNWSDLNNNIDQSSKTGHNDLSRNTGPTSDPAVITGHGVSGSTDRKSVV